MLGATLMTMSEDPVWLTAPEVAKKIGRNVEKTRELLEEGRFPGAYRLDAGSHWRVPEGAVDAFLEAIAARVRPFRRGDR